MVCSMSVYCVYAPTYTPDASAGHNGIHCMLCVVICFYLLLTVPHHVHTRAQERDSAQEELQTTRRVLSQVREMLQRDNSTLQDIRDLLNMYPVNTTM